jgi:ABC-2 type transport system ATP-binding protein
MTQALSTEQSLEPEIGSSGGYLRVRGVRKRFPQRRPLREAVRAPFARTWVEALRGISFSVAMGEFYGLLGANGAGKTTLMKIIATLISADHGSVHVGDLDVETDSARVRDVVSIALATERGLYWRLSAWENLRLFADLNEIPKAHVRSRIGEAIDTVSLGEAKDRMVREFSSGMIQRLLIARALLTEPQLLLLDEPTRSLDPISAREFRRFLREEFAVKRQCAVLLATHNADEAFDLCNRVAILDRGAIIAEGTAHDLAYDVLGSRHILTTTNPDHVILSDLARQSRFDVVRVERGRDDASSRILLRIPGGEVEASQVLKELIEGGLVVSSFSRETASLADLIEGVIAREAAS